MNAGKREPGSCWFPGIAIDRISEVEEPAPTAAIRFPPTRAAIPGVRL